ncbi:MAG: ribbon-helix-helix protein, CopG family [Chloroflexi bacterium]|nr:ribbon-helix-helix protein, CopG family [Ardenticatenaceae bacterium]MBL1130320.1 ribbon-helix-helix protein, CopG family [Chloroflexota bacterium]NOG36411.1 ribbon-helix-helix protein, CopG family [Chloroflexota bacterium]GIK57294.1 MAG: hypothetical protein BroJett015_29570 [Chloroflexota bacterium]
MATTKVAVTIESELLAEIDQLVAQRLFPNRSKAIQEALRDSLEKIKRNRLARECANLDPDIEEAMAEEGMEWELAEWPEY